MFPLGPVKATGTVMPDLHIVFATCAGQLSATMEHQWLVSDPRADRTQEHRAAMIALLQATTPAQEARTTLSRRIEAKMAHAALLTRATFNSDPEDAKWAQDRAAHIVAGCTAMLLS